MSFSLEINIYYYHEVKVCSKTIICSNGKMTFHPSQIFEGAFEYTLKRRDATHRVLGNTKTRFVNLNEKGSVVTKPPFYLHQYGFEKQHPIECFYVTHSVRSVYSNAHKGPAKCKEILLKFFCKCSVKTGLSLIYTNFLKAQCPLITERSKKISFIMVSCFKCSIFFSK